MLLLRQLAEATAAIDPQGIVANKSLDGARKKANASAATDEMSFGDEPMIPPAGNGLGGDVEAIRQVFDRQDVVAGYGRRGDCIVTLLHSVQGVSGAGKIITHRGMARKIAGDNAVKQVETWSGIGKRSITIGSHH
jgi:hypothetical protein